MFTERGIWGFNPDYLTGVYVSNLPVEEILFFFCIPYACVFTYYALQYLIAEKKYSRKWSYWPFLLFTALMFFFYQAQAYTFWTFFLLFIFLFYVWLKQLNINLPTISYLLIFPFFLASNGILTGSFLPEPIVWYNDEENMGFRLFTIPFEDLFYGYLLIVPQMLLFENFKKK